MTTGLVEPGKRTAGRQAANLVEDGMCVGLGSGTTAHEFVRALGERVAAGLNITGVASSSATASLARSLNIPLTELDQQLDLAVDGADLIERSSLNAIKGLGGALVREKLIALAASEFVLVADESKVTGRLSQHVGVVPISVEIIPFGWSRTLHRLEKFGNPVLRRSGPDPYVTDNHNYIIDLYGYDGQDIAAVACQLKSTAGVVDHGLFIQLATRAIIGSGERSEVIERPSP